MDSDEESAYRAYMGYLNSLPREQKCDCGWAARGDCYGMCYGDPDKGGAVPQTQKDADEDAEPLHDALEASEEAKRDPSSVRPWADVRAELRGRAP